jgi:hypothetical protein
MPIKWSGCLLPARGRANDVGEVMTRHVSIRYYSKSKCKSQGELLIRVRRHAVQTDQTNAKGKLHSLTLTLISSTGKMNRHGIRNC